MTASGFGKLFAASAAGVASAVGLIAFLNYVNGQDGFAACTITTGPGWLVPAVLGLAVGGTIWSLLERPARSTSRSAANATCTCGQCGGMVLSDWRLCPHCGSEFAEATSTQVSC